MKTKNEIYSELFTSKPNSDDLAFIDSVLTASGLVEEVAIATERSEMERLEKLNRPAYLAKEDGTIVEHDYAQQQKRVEELKKVLSDCESFVDRHSEDWYKTGQELLVDIREALTKKDNHIEGTQ